MFILLHEGESLGTTQFESGDPATNTVSGAFNNFGGAIALSAWIMSNGGTEDGEVIYKGLDKTFVVTTQDGRTIPFEEATLIAVPDSGEAYLECITQSTEDYKQFFAEHLLALA